MKKAWLFRAHMQAATFKKKSVSLGLAEVQWVKPLNVMPTSYRISDLSPGCSASANAPVGEANAPVREAETGPSTWVPASHMGDPMELLAPAFGLA